LPAIRDSETVGGVATGRAGRLADSTGVPNLWLVGLGRGSENVTTTGTDYPFGIYPFAQTTRPFDAQIEPQACALFRLAAHSRIVMPGGRSRARSSSAPVGPDDLSGTVGGIDDNYCLGCQMPGRCGPRGGQVAPDNVRRVGCERDGEQPAHQIDAAAAAAVGVTRIAADFDGPKSAVPRHLAGKGPPGCSA
jgi:hypothetical protein